MATTPTFSSENSMDRGAWWATAYEAAKSQTWLSTAHTHIHSPVLVVWNPDYTRITWVVWKAPCPTDMLILKFTWKFKGNTLEKEDRRLENSYFWVSKFVPYGYINWFFTRELTQFNGGKAVFFSYKQCWDSWVPAEWSSSHDTQKLTKNSSET